MFSIQIPNSILNNAQAYPIGTYNTNQTFVLPVNNNFDTVQISSSVNQSTDLGSWITNIFNEILNAFKPDTNKNARLSDNEYRTTLANTLGCKPESLASIMGPDELKTNLGKFRKENFSSGDVPSEDFEKRFKGVLNGEFIVSLHNHTDFSDGLLGVETFLNQAVHYADKVAKIRTEKGIKSDLPCFTVAVTDHDTMEGAKEAVKLVSQNPEKYKNLKLVLGLEQAATIKTDFLHRPIIIEILGYCVNPFDKDINRFLYTLQNDRIDKANKGIAEFNKYGYNYTLDGMRKDRNSEGLLRRAISKGFLPRVKKYLDKATNKQRSPEINTIFPNYDISDIPPIEKAMAVFRKSPSGIFGLAHPGRVELDKNIIPTKVQASVGKDKVQQAMYMLLSRLKELGVTAAEANYQYTRDHYDSPYDKELLDNIDNCCDKLGLLKAGGEDGHEDMLTHSHNARYVRNGHKYDGLAKSDLNYLLGIPAA